MINKDKLVISNNRRHFIIKFDEIIYLKGEGMYTTIYLNDSNFIISKNIKCIENKLPNHIFIRIHQSYLVNIHRIKYVTLKDKANIITDIGVELPISKTFKSRLKLVLEDNYIKI